MRMVMLAMVALSYFVGSIAYLPFAYFFSVKECSDTELHVWRSQGC
jgi:hypothetical protein